MSIFGFVMYARSDRVDVRCVPWDELAEEYLVTATALYYNQSMWDVHEMNALTQMHYAGLTREEKAMALALGYVNPGIVGLLAEPLREFLVDLPWCGIHPGEAVVGGVGVGHILPEQVRGSASDRREGLVWPE